MDKATLEEIEKLKMEYARSNVLWRAKDAEIANIRKEYAEKIDKITDERDNKLRPINDEIRELRSVYDKEIISRCYICEKKISIRCSTEPKTFNGEVFYTCETSACSDKICKCGRPLKSKIRIQGVYRDFCSYQCPVILEDYELGKISLNCIEVIKLYAPDTPAAKKAEESFNKAAENISK